MEAFELGVPGEGGSADFAADVHQVADDGRPVADFDISVRQLTRADTVDEIADVRRALTGTFFCGVRRTLTEFRTVGLEVAAQDLDLTVGTLKDGTELLVIVNTRRQHDNVGSKPKFGPPSSAMEDISCTPNT